MARRYKKPKIRIPMKGDTPDMFQRSQPSVVKEERSDPVTHDCAVCGAKFASFGIDGKWLCGDHWRLTAHYQWLMFREFFKLMEDEDG